jgi:predicted transcriptional regulator
LAKLFEKIIRRRLRPILEEKRLIPPHQFGFRLKYSPLEQVHRIVSKIEKDVEENESAQPHS